MGDRLRPPPALHVTFAPPLWDDGEQLTPGPLFDPVQVPLSELRGSPFYERFMAEFAATAAELERQRQEQPAEGSSSRAAPARR